MDDAKILQTLVGCIAAGFIILVTAVALDARHEDNQVSKCIENGNGPIECSMAFDGAYNDKLILQAIKELQAERE